MNNASKGRCVTVTPRGIGKFDRLEIVKSQITNRKSLMQPDDIIPLDPDEFFAAHEYAAMVAENEFLDEIPALRKKMKFGDQMLRFANVPANRFGFAVMEFFEGRKHDKGWSFMMRFFAMMGVMKR